MSHIHVKSVRAELVNRTQMVAGTERVVSSEDVIMVLADNLPDPMTGIPMVDHLIVIPPEAVGNRMLLYKLGSRGEALDAILCEHAIRLHGMEPRPRQGHKAQGDTQPEVTYAPGAREQAKDVLDQHADRIIKYYTRTSIR